MPHMSPQSKPPREGKAGMEDHVLHLITREAFAMTDDQRALALSLLRAVRSWAPATPQ